MFILQIACYSAVRLVNLEYCNTLHVLLQTFICVPCFLINPQLSIPYHHRHHHHYHHHHCHLIRQAWP